MTQHEFAMAVAGRTGWIDRHRPLLADVQLALFLVGAVFWVGSIHEPALFAVTTWGTLAYAVPAEAWAALNMLCSAMIWVGLIRPIKRRLVLFGAAVNVVQYCVLALSAVAFGGDRAVGIYALAVFIPLFGRMAWEAWRDARGTVH